MQSNEKSNSNKVVDLEKVRKAFESISTTEGEWAEDREWIVSDEDLKWAEKNMSYDDWYDLNLFYNLERSIDDYRHGRYCTLEEARQEYEEWRATKYDDNYVQEC